MSATETCFRCRAGWHAECIDPERLESENSEGEAEVVYYACCCYHSKKEVFVETPGDGVFELVVDTRTTPRLKDGADMKDVVSTGRKRAAILFPVDPAGMECEWARLAEAGGGVHPIIGCRGNIIFPEKMKDDIPEGAQPGAIHHGPDKSVLNNEPHNISRICVTCHNRWHALNNPYYSKDRPDQGATYLPLSGTVLPLVRHGLQSEQELVLATEAQFHWSDMYWTLPDKQRQALPYEPKKVLS